MTKKIIIFSAALLAIIITIIVFFVFKKAPQPKVPPTITAPSQPAEAFYVTSFYPSGEAAKSISVIASVKINFNDIINKNSFVYTINPNIATEINIATNSATINPKTSWPMGEKITITVVSAQNNSGTKLSFPYIINLLIPIPQGE